MRKLALFRLITVIVLIILTGIYVVYHHQSISIHKSLTMISLNENDYFKNKNNQRVGTEQDIHHEFQLDLHLVYHKRIFKNDYYTGTMTINNENEYKVVSTTSHGDAHYLVFINNRDPFDITNIEFSLLEKNQFDSVVINDVEIDGTEYLLAGPATTVEDAEKKLFIFYPLPDN